MQTRTIILATLIAITLMFWKPLMLTTHLRNLTTLTQKLTTPNPNFKTMSTSQTAIVIGSGLAGLSASSQLLSQNIPVLLLERSPKPGGNSIKASSGINGAPTKYQGVKDTHFYADTLKSAGGAMKEGRERREKLMRVLTEESKGAVEWLVDTKGVDLSVVARLGGHSVARTHRGGGKVPPGAAIVTALLRELNGEEGFELVSGATVTKVLRSSEGMVNGVRYQDVNGEEKEVFGPVVFASGGFAGDSFGMLAKYRPDLTGFPSTNEPRPGTQHLLTEVGAQLLDMTHVQVHPTAFIDPLDPTAMVKFLAAEMLRGEGGFLLDAAGERFVNELETRKIVTAAITALPHSEIQLTRQWDVYLVLDEGAYKACESHMAFYLWKGLMRKTTIAGLPSPSAALTTIRNYATCALSPSSTQDCIFGRTSFGGWSLAPEDASEESVVYVGMVTPAIHFTMGGVMINEAAEVLDKDGKAIGGLWAAGEITGGIHGENRLGGSSLLECVVFGRRAGDGVAKSLWKKL